MTKLHAGLTPSQPASDPIDFPPPYEEDHNAAMVLFQNKQWPNNRRRHFKTTKILFQPDYFVLSTIYCSHLTFRSP